MGCKITHVSKIIKISAFTPLVFSYPLPPQSRTLQDAHEPHWLHKKHFLGNKKP